VAGNPEVLSCTSVRILSTTHEWQDSCYLWQKASVPGPGEEAQELA